MDTMMNRMKAATVAAMLAGALSLGGLAVQAQTPSPGTGQAGAGDPSCMGAMHEMMTMMREHMGAGMIGPASSAMHGMMTPGASMGPGMMPPASSAGAMGPMDDECVAFMDQMMGMMRDHMGTGMMGPSPTMAPSPASHDAHHPSTSPDPATPSESASAAVRIVVTLTDAFRIEPGAMVVPVGVPVTFVVTNIGAIPHEFVVGDEASQDAHEKTMRGTGAMSHDDPDAIGVAPGETKELTMTFSVPGETLAGCHVPGHYPAGMRATITVAP
jgi:uncharacterized cupredoxin-like copper-binding protein